METENRGNIDKSRGVYWEIMEQMRLKEALININNKVIIRDYADIINHKSTMNISLKDYENYYHNNFSNKEIDRRVLLIV